VSSSAIPVAPGANFSVGRQDVTSGRYFKGDIDEVAIYTAATPGSTVTTHHDTGRQASNTNGLTTRTVYDALGRAIDETDAARVRYATAARPSIAVNEPTF
jgi:YD repeat-containing protein